MNGIQNKLSQDYGSEGDLLYILLKDKQYDKYIEMVYKIKKKS